MISTLETPKIDYESTRDALKADISDKIKCQTSFNDITLTEFFFYFSKLNVILVLDPSYRTMRVINESADNDADASEFDFNKFPQATLEYLDNQGYRFVRIAEIANDDAILNIKRAANKQLHAVWDDCDDYVFELHCLHQCDPSVALYEPSENRLNTSSNIKHVIHIGECFTELNELFANDLEMSFRIAQTKAILSTLSLKLTMRIIRSRFEKYPNYKLEVIDYKPHVITIKLNKAVFELYPQGKFKTISRPKRKEDDSGIPFDEQAIMQLMDTTGDL